MKINEVEERLGIPKKSIRYYEDEGLLHPARSANGYRDYAEEDVRILKEIKVYRKLSLPIAEIKKIMSGQLTIGEAVERHKIYLVHQRKDLDTQVYICDQMLEDVRERNVLDPDAYLEKIACLEQSGVTFHNAASADHRKAVSGVWISAVSFAIMMMIGAAAIIWAYVIESMPIGIFILFELICVGPAIGVFVAGYFRMKEIAGGEEDDLSKY